MRLAQLDGSNRTRNRFRSRTDAPDPEMKDTPVMIPIPRLRKRSVPAALALSFLAWAGAPFAAAGAAAGFSGDAGQELPARVNIRLVSRLENELSRIEGSAADCRGVDPKSIRNVTIPLQNYIEDIVLASGVYVDIYPTLIRNIICIEARNGLSRQEIAILLLRFQKENKYRILLLDRTYEPGPGGQPEGEEP
jgi:hypothetical protein